MMSMTNKNKVYRKIQIIDLQKLKTMQIKQVLPMQ